VITDVPGIRVGHATDPVALTGVTVALFDPPAVAGVELRGWANDVVGLDYLDPRHLVGTIDGVVLGGGSRSWKVIGPPAILERLPGVEVVNDLAKVPEPAA